jgi:hypothetical protein
MTAKSTIKKTVNAAFENKYTKPIAVGLATPVVVVGYIPLVCWQTRKSVMH